MNRTHEPSTTAILSPVDESTLAGLKVSDDFTGSRDGIEALLTVAAASPDERLAVAICSGGEIVAYLRVRSPAPKTRLYSVVPAVELAGFEVAGPHRRLGIFTALFHSLFKNDLEESILFVIADPEMKERGDSARSYRSRAAAVLGSVGFVPMPTDELELHPHKDATLFVRMGRGVPKTDVEDFFKRLRASPYASVGIALREPFLRNLLRADLERNGFRVSSVSSISVPLPADVVISDGNGGTGRELTVRLNGGVEVQASDGTLWYPAMELDRLPGILRAELDRRRGRHA